MMAVSKFQLKGGRCTGRLPQTFNPKYQLFFGRYVNRSRIKTTPMASLPIDFRATVDAAMDWVNTGMFLNGPDSQAVAVLTAAPFNMSLTAATELAANGLGDCFWASMVRRMQFSALTVGAPVWTNYSDMLKAALMGYMMVGWNPKDPVNSDQGTDPTTAWPVLQKTGLLASDGTYEQIGAVLQVNPNDVEEMIIAANVCGGISFGFNLPEAWENSQVWDVTNSPIAGGHEVPEISDLKVSNNGAIDIDSWGTVCTVTAGALVQNCDQATVFINKRMLGPSGLNINGLDTAQIQADVQATQGV
jgi:hypothetical protein